MNKKVLAIALFLLMQVQIFAQTQKWEATVENDVEWTKITDVGVLLVGTKNFNLMGIDPVSGKILWSSDFMEGAKSLKGPDMKKLGADAAFEQSVHLLEDPTDKEISNFIEIRYNDPMGLKNFAILNVFTGEEIISPRKAKMPIVKFFGKEMATFNYNGTAYIPELKSVIISASYADYTQKGNPVVDVTKMISLPSGKELWETKEMAIDGYPFVMENGDIVLAGKTQIVRFDSQTGAKKWTYATEDKKVVFESFDISFDLTSACFFEKRKNSGYLSALNLSTGKKLWGTEMKLKEIPQLTALPDGILIGDEKYLTLYDLNNGSKKWAAKKVVGTVVDLGANGIAVASRGKYLVLLDRATGEVKWDEKIKGIQIDQIAAKGIMYSDEKGRLGLIQYDGQKVWDKKGMLEKPTLRYKPTYTSELIYFEGKLYDVDLMTGEYKLLKEKINKEFGGEETPEKIELVEGGYLLSSAQNLLMLEKDGSVRWKKYFPAPKMSLGARIALRTLQVAMMAAAASSSMQAAQHRTAYGGETYESKRYSQDAQNFANISAGLGSEATKKFTASVSRGNYLLILTVVGEGGQNKGSGLVKIDKRTGEEVGKLQLGDKEPTYDYDPVKETLFFKAEKKKIVAYKL